MNHGLAVYTPVTDTDVFVFKTAFLVLSPVSQKEMIIRVSWGTIGWRMFLWADVQDLHSAQYPWKHWAFSKFLFFLAESLSSQHLWTDEEKYHIFVQQNDERPVYSALTCGILSLHLLPFWRLICHLSSFPTLTLKHLLLLLSSSLPCLVLWFSFNNRPHTSLFLRFCPLYSLCLILFFWLSVVSPILVSVVLSFLCWSLLPHVSLLQCSPPHLGWHHSHHAVAVPRWTEGWIWLPAVQELHVSRVCHQSLVSLSWMICFFVTSVRTLRTNSVLIKREEQCYTSIEILDVSVEDVLNIPPHSSPVLSVRTGNLEWSLKISLQLI